MFRFLLISSLVFVFSSCQYLGQPYALNYEDDQDDGSELASEEAEIKTSGTKLYQVSRSDSIASIARKTGSTVQEIILLNGLSKPYYLKPGELIKIPKGRASKSDVVERKSVIIAPKGSRK